MILLGGLTCVTTVTAEFSSSEPNQTCLGKDLGLKAQIKKSCPMTPWHEIQLWTCVFIVPLFGMCSLTRAVLVSLGSTSFAQTYGGIDQRLP